MSYNSIWLETSRLHQKSINLDRGVQCAMNLLRLVNNNFFVQLYHLLQVAFATYDLYLGDYMFA